MKLLNGQFRWVLVCWMSLMGAISFLHRVNISIAGQAVQTEFGMSNVQLGYVFSAFVLGYALFQVPGGRFADRFGPRVVVTMGALWWSAFTALTALVPPGLWVSIGMLVGVRFLLGAGEAVVFPASNRLVANWIPTMERGTANGIIFSGVGIGSAVTPPLITYLLVNWGWHWSFYVSAIIGVLAGAAWHVMARNTPKAHPWVTKKELTLIESGLGAPPGSVDAQKTTPWSSVLRNRHIGLLTLSYFTYGYSAFIFFSWFFIYLNKVRGLDLKSSSFYSVLPFLAMAVCSPLGGWIADILTRRWGRRVGRCGLGVLGLAGAGLFITFATQVASAQVASVFLTCGVGSLYLAQSSYWAVTADIAGRSAGAVSGLMNMGGQIGGAVTATLTPMIAASFGWPASFLTAAGLCLLGAIAWSLVNPDVKLAAG